MSIRDWRSVLKLEEMQTRERAKREFWTDDYAELELRRIFGKHLRRARDAASPIEALIRDIPEPFPRDWHDPPSPRSR